MDDLQQLKNKLTALKEQNQKKKTDIYQLQQQLFDYKENFSNLSKINKNDTEKIELMNQYIGLQHMISDVNVTIDHRTFCLNQMRTTLNAENKEIADRKKENDSIKEQIESNKKFLEHIEIQNKNLQNDDCFSHLADIDRITTQVPIKYKEVQYANEQLSQLQTEYTNLINQNDTEMNPHLLHTFQMCKKQSNFQLTCLSIGFDSQTLVSGSNEGNLTLVNFRDVTTPSVYKTAATPNTIKMHPNDPYCLIPCDSGLIWKYDFYTSTLSQPFQIPSKTDFLDLDFSGRFVVASSSDRTLKVLDMTRQYLNTVPTPFLTNSIASSLDEIVFCGCNDGTLALFDTRQGKVTYKEKAHDQKILKLCLPIFGYEVYTIGGEGFLKCFDVRKIGTETVFDIDLGRDLGRTMAVSPCGKMICVTSDDNSFTIFDKNGKQNFRSPAGNAKIAALTCAENMVIAGNVNQSVQLWEI